MLALTNADRIWDRARQPNLRWLCLPQRTQGYVIPGAAPGLANVAGRPQSGRSGQPTG